MVLKSINIDLDISINKASSITICFNADECEDLDIKNSLGKYFGDTVKYEKEENSLEATATCYVGDVRKV